jgi:hypothetical protein
MVIRPRGLKARLVRRLAAVAEPPEATQAILALFKPRGITLRPENATQHSYRARAGSAKPQRRPDSSIFPTFFSAMTLKLGVYCRVMAENSYVTSRIRSKDSRA